VCSPLQAHQTRLSISSFNPKLHLRSELDFFAHTFSLAELIMQMTIFQLTHNQNVFWFFRVFSVIWSPNALIFWWWKAKNGFDFWQKKVLAIKLELSRNFNFCVFSARFSNFLSFCYALGKSMNLENREHNIQFFSLNWQMKVVSTFSIRNFQWKLIFSMFNSPLKISNSYVCRRHV
jgi:hypothetical protein